MRLSSNTSTPRSLRLRISRPNPCFSAIAACGTWYSKNAFPPASFNARMRASTTGSLGTANGSLSMITQLNWSPCTSTPCQNDEVANRTQCGVVRNSSSRMRCGAVPRESADHGNAHRDARCRGEEVLHGQAGHLHQIAHRRLAGVALPVGVGDETDGRIERRVGANRGQMLRVERQPDLQSLQHVDGRGAEHVE